MIRLPPRSTRTVTLMPYTTLVRARPGRILVLGLTFKEDVPDLRNSRVVDIVDALAGRGHAVDVHDPHADAGEARSEEHTSELQSLMRISYAVFCLKKKKEQSELYKQYHNSYTHEHDNTRNTY